MTNQIVTISIFGTSSAGKTSNNPDTLPFVEKPEMRTIFFETNIEEDINLKNQFRLKGIPNPIRIREVTSNNYVDDLFKNPSIVRNCALVDFNDKKLKDVRSVKVNSLPAVREHLTPKNYVDEFVSNSLNEPTLVPSKQNNDFIINSLSNKSHKILNNEPVEANHAVIKSYVDNVSENKENRRNLSVVFNNQSKDFDKINSTNLKWRISNGDPIINEEVDDKNKVENIFLEYHYS